MTDKERMELVRAYADLEWVVDILKRIEEIVDKDPFIGNDSNEAIKWLIKQGMKVKREE